MVPVLLAGCPVSRPGPQLTCRFDASCRVYRLGRRLSYHEAVIWHVVRPALPSLYTPPAVRCSLPNSRRPPDTAQFVGGASEGVLWHHVLCQASIKLRCVVIAGTLGDEPAKVGHAARGGSLLANILECAMSIPVLDADIESELADMRDVPLAEISGDSCQIPAR